MGKILVSDIPKKQREAILRNLSAVLTKVGDERTMASLLRQLLTDSEVVMLGRRLEIAARLRRGQSYIEIREELGVGFATIQSVARWLQDLEGSLPKEEQFKPSRLTINPVGFSAPGADTFSARTNDLLTILDLIFSLFDSKDSKSGRPGGSES